uniref:Replication timing regulatory factor 1 n=1 Tax=Malurus cyaneus samueli TaxID=2593467 RepID=A0A8C5U2Z7_9PASS
TVNSVAVKSSDKNTRTRALWVISKQSFPPEIVKKEVSNILSTLETILTKGEVQSVVVEYEALNVIIRLMEQTPAQMGEEAVRWAKLIIPLVVHSAHKVQLRGATALEMGMPLLLQKQQEVAAVTEHLMTTKLISELQKLFSTKNETFVLKLWPLFVRLLGKTLHRSGSFINSLLQLEELGFRSGSPVVKKIAFIAWKSLIDNFALNPDILCSAKRLKLLMQPLSSIHVRTEALALTKLEVWWYLLMRLGPHLPSNFEQVCVPLIQSTLSLDPAGTPSRLPNTPNLGPTTPGQKSGTETSTWSRFQGALLFPSIQLLGIEMLLHFFMGPAVVDFAKQNKLVLSLEPLQYPLISSPSFFCKHASTLINAVQDGFIAVEKKFLDINGYVKTAIEAGNKKEKQGSEILTMLLQALKNTVASNSLPVQKILSLIDITVKELPPKVLGSPAYQVADMDLLNGTPALFLIQLPFHNNLLESCVTDERFFVILETLVGFVLSGPTSALAFSESVLGVVDQSAKQVENKEHLWRMWSIVVNPLTEWINQTNEVNQGDALEHNFSAVYSALLLPVSHIFPTQGFPQPTLKSLLRTWSDLYRAFARCAALVATAEENLCCEELCAKIIAGLEGETPVMFPMLEGLTHVVSVMVDCINFAPYGTKFQPKTRSPQTPTDWAKKKKEPLGKLASLFKLLLMLLNSFHEFSSKEIPLEPLMSVGPPLLGALHTIISHISLPSIIGTTFAIFSKPLAEFYEKNKSTPCFFVLPELEKLLAEILQCLQCHCPGSCDTELLEQLSPVLCVAFQHRNKQLRQQSAQFWNSTFAKASSLTYPEQLKSVLSQVKKKIPLLLPGFESIEISEECSGPFSDTVNILLPQFHGNEIVSLFRRVVRKTLWVCFFQLCLNIIFIGQIFCCFLGQEENAESEGGHPEEGPACNSEEESKNETAEMIPAETSTGEGSEMSSVEAASKESSAEKENTSNGSSGSASSDIISGTPQPVSRRQSFITLEKFGAAESRPFSPAPLNSVLEVSGAATPESSSDSKASAKAEKCGEENKNAPKAEPEAGSAAIRRVTRRQSRMELQGNKSKLQGRAEESPAPDSVESSAEPGPAGEDVENTLPSPSQAQHSMESDSRKAEDENTEMEKALDTDSKENNPPSSSSPPEQPPAEDSPVAPVSPQHKVLRRSSRRRSETVESSSDSQDREDGPPKRDRRKEDEKTGQKKQSQGKDDGAQKQKGISGKTTESTKESSQAERVAEDLSCRDSPAARGLDEEGSRGGRRAEDSPRAEGEAQDSLSSVGQKVVERPRYHTRRASQGLLSSIENSEADSSEAKEESTKKKKHIKGRSRSDSLEGKLKSEAQPESHSQEVSPQGNENKNSQEETKGEPEISPGAAVTAEPCGLEKQTIPAAAGETVGPGSSENAGAALDSSVELKGDASMESLGSPCVSEQEGRAAQEQEEKQTSTGDWAPGTSISGTEASPLQSPECQNKRSKRVKKIKSCDCCFKKPKQHVTESKLSEVKKEKSEPEEPQSTPVQTAVNVSGNSDLEESLALAPCAMSTPLPPPKESFSLEGQGMTLDNLQGSTGGEENTECAAEETTEPMEEIKEPAEQKEQTEQVLPDSIPEEPMESCLDMGNQQEEPAAAEKEEIGQNGQLEEVSEELSVDSKAEEKEIEEPEGNEEEKEEAEDAAGESCVVADKELKEELEETEIKVPEDAALGSVSADSPLKAVGESSVQVTESPTSLGTRTWSPLASPSTSILKRGVKRSQEDDSLSPANKIRRVSFANPIFQEGLADDIDRRSPVVRSHSSPSSRSLKILSNMQVKHITTPTKGFLSPGSRTLKFKSSKKCLITEMAKESLPCPTEFVYPALAGCKAPVDVILPQITSNICARGLGQLIRAKNIKTVGDLSTLTALEIKTLPIRSPKVSNVKRALKGYHEQQVKSRALEENVVLEDAEKPGNDVEDKSLCGDEEKLATDLAEAAPGSSEQPPADLPGQIQALAAQLSSEDLHSYSGQQLFQMQEHLATMASCILRNLQSRWLSPPHPGPE